MTDKFRMIPWNGPPMFDWWRESGATEFDGATTTMSMQPLPSDLAPPPVVPVRDRLRGLARRLLRYALSVLGALRPEDRATQEPPMFLCSRLRATHIASATHKGLRGFERWVR